MKMKHVWRIECAICALTLILGSCVTTRNSAFDNVDKLVTQGAYGQAADALRGKDSENLYAKTDQVLLNLDSGMLYQVAGRYTDSNKAFDQAESLMEDYFTKSISEAAGSFLVNDNVLTYAGEAYEDLYTNVFKAINYASMKNFDDAYVEMKRLNDKLNLLEDKYQKLADSENDAKDAKVKVKVGKIEFNNSALSRYISMLLYRADGQADNARIDLKKLNGAFKDQPDVYNFPVPEPVLANALAPVNGKARLNVISFAGKSPIKRANSIRLDTFPGRVAITVQRENEKGEVRVISHDSFYFPVEGGFHFACRTPYLSVPPSRVAKVAFVVDGQAAGQLSLLEDLGNVAAETFKLHEPLIYTKTIIRTVVKGIANELAKKEMQAHDSTGGIASFLGGLATDVIVDASEQADLRAARYFPAKAYVGEVLVDPGVHSISVRYFDAAGNLIREDLHDNYVVDTKGLNLVTSYGLF